MNVLGTYPLTYSIARPVARVHASIKYREQPMEGGKHLSIAFKQLRKNCIQSREKEKIVRTTCQGG